MNEKVYLIDGSSFLYRFFFAIRGLSYKGMPTGTIFGFAKLLLELDAANPTYIAIFFDTKAKTFREDILESYKKNRPKMPDELSIQIEPTKQLIKAFGIPIIELDGFEADDLIATYAEKLKNDFEVIIIASDKDLFQLVNSNVKIYDPTKKVFYDREGVFKKLGVYPEQVADFLALVGDSIDNIPGVKSIGPKTAASLLAQYKNIEGILQNLDNLKPKIKEAIEKEKDNLELYRKLTITDKKAPIKIELEAMKKKEKDIDKIQELFLKFGFKSLLKSLPVKHNTVSMSKSHTILMALNKSAILIENNQIKRIEPGFVNTDIETVYDFKELLTQGFQFEKYPFDIKLASYLVNPDSKGNPRVCFENINDEAFAKLMNLSEEEAILESYPFLREYIEGNNLNFLLSQVETPLSEVLVSMEKRGIKIDSEYLTSFENELANKLYATEKQIHALAGEEFNINSTKELQRILFEKLGIKPIKKTKTGYSTDSESLQMLAQKYEIAQLIITYRAISKVISTYIRPFLDKMDKSNRLHTTFNQTLTSTGRLSSSNPNLQNLPAGDDELHSGIRKSVVAPKGYKLICSDYSQIELRVLAQMSKDKTLIEIFKNNEDIHTQTAVKIFGVHPSMVDHHLRRMAKTINFGIIYGMGYVSLSKTLNISKDKARQFIEKYFERFAGVKSYIENTTEKATKNGFVETYFGRRRYFFNINSNNKRLAQFEKRAAVNATIQGTAADIIKIAMVKLYEKLKNLDAHIVLQVHDELLVEAKEDIAENVAGIVKDTMENAVKFDIPIKTNTKIANNWYEAK
ncbi:DNA polymerase I [Hippea maritima]|uniref:DNA polymerase I n=1 Tax=Hippea maritima (strain ATCC 700847 / DSM 10411 / MH2) TaxID=760142 RepID=F2LX06_HIPMA|nr:DNA polymerase I [Hippea maritima]AEA34190.1 DNA polymerase I [Hippea maritima DSM 10411]